MIFKDLAMLFGLLAVSVPIIIHLLNRRQARRIDWGAMRFLMASLTSRKRHIMIEEIILMAVRCLLLALLALAMARPFLPTRSTIPWLIVLPAGLGAIICLGIAVAGWSLARLRWAMLTSAVALLAIAGLSTAYEYYGQNRSWAASSDAKDVAVVIDGSSSMALTHEGKTNFQRAVEEARAAVDACDAGDAISLILAGPVPRGVVPNPITDRAKLQQALNDLKPSGGSMKTLEALNLAAASLQEGQNIGKRVILITDAQNLGWDLANGDRWFFLASGLKTLTTKPEIVCRTLSVPSSFENLAASDIVLSRSAVGTDRPVGIDVKVTNSGTTTVVGAVVTLTVNGVGVAQEKLSEVPPNAVGTAHFTHQFDKVGMNVITAQIAHGDAMAQDNVIHRVVQVIDRLRVLVIDGAPSARPLDSAAAFVELAFTPASPEERTRLLAVRNDPKAPPPAVSFILESEVKDYTRLERDEDFSEYSLVVLANVPDLSPGPADRLVRFVREGGGLLIAPGDHCQLSQDETNPRTSYSDWKTPAGEMIAPARLVRRRLTPDKPVRPAIKSFNHPALRLVTDLARSDLDALMVHAYWQLSVPADDKNVHVAAQLDSGDPLLVERSFGRGFVMMTALTLDRRDSNLPSLKSFVPLMHELAYHLSAPLLAQPNVQPGGELTIDLSPKLASREKPAPLDANELDVKTPAERHEPAACSLSGQDLRIRFTRTAEPGLYRCGLTPALAERFRAMPTEPACVPFTVLGDPGESSLVTLSDEDWQALGKHLAVRRVVSTPELKAAIVGYVPGEELSRYMVLAALAVILSEIALTRWISAHRKSHQVQNVVFGDNADDAATMRARAREMVAVK